jgi:hypothetical protein
MTLEQFSKIKELQMIGWIYQNKNSDEILFQKKIGTLSEGHDLLLDQIHKNIQSILHFFHAKPFFPIYRDMSISTPYIDTLFDHLCVTDPNQPYIDILYDHLCELSLSKNKSYAIDEIKNFYYTNVWEEKFYNYSDHKNLNLANMNKQIYLSKSIHQILHQLRLTSNDDVIKDKKTLHKISAYFTKFRTNE